MSKFDWKVVLNKTLFPLYRNRYKEQLFNDIAGLTTAPAFTSWWGPVWPSLAETPSLTATSTAKSDRKFILSPSELTHIRFALLSIPSDLEKYLEGKIDTFEEVWQLRSFLTHLRSFSNNNFNKCTCFIAYNMALSSKHTTSPNLHVL